MPVRPLSGLNYSVHLCAPSSQRSHSLRSSVPLILSAVLIIPFICASHPLTCLNHCVNETAERMRISVRSGAKVGACGKVTVYGDESPSHAKIQREVPGLTCFSSAVDVNVSNSRVIIITYLVNRSLRFGPSVNYYTKKL